MPFWKRGNDEGRQRTQAAPRPQMERVLQGRGRVDRLAMMPDGRRVVSSGLDGSVNVWDIPTGILEGSFRAPESADAALTPDGKRIVSLGQDGKARIFDLYDGSLVGTIDGMKEGARSMALTPDGARIATCGSAKPRKGELEIWDISSGSLQLAIESPEGRWLSAVAVTPDGTRIVAGGSGEIGTFSGTICVWDLATATLERSIDGLPESVRGLAVTPDGGMIVTSFNETMIQAWDIATGSLQQTLTTIEIQVGKGGPAPVPYLEDFAVTADGRRVAGAAAFNTVQVWDLASGRVLYAMRPGTMFGSTNGVAVTPDGSRVLVGTDDAAVRVWVLPAEPAT